MGTASVGNGWSPRHTWLLGAVALAGLAWRLHVALTAPWYWDEGYVAEFVQSLARAPFSRPHIGALWEDGFFPLSTSLLAPYSAVPFVLPTFWSAMTGVRLWAVALDMASLGLLVLLARPRENPRLALLTAACYALLPFAAEFGGRAFYHHFSVALMLACLVLGRGLFEEEGLSSQRVAGASLCAGLAVGGCYWLWWFGVLWCLLLAWKRPKGWAWGWVWAALPVLAVLTADILPDPRGAWWSIQGLLKTSGTTGPKGVEALLRALTANLAVLPFLGVGLLGLAWEAWRRRGPWPWFALCLAGAVLEPIRQRGTIAGAPYPFQIAAPLAALGAAALADRLLGTLKGSGLKTAGIARVPSRGSAAALLALPWAAVLFFKPIPLGTMRLWSFQPKRVAELRSFFSRTPCSGDLVCGMPEFNWDLRPGLRDCEPIEVAAAEGHATGFYEPGAPSSRFAYPCRLDEVRYAVISRVHLLGLFRFPGMPLTFLEMEHEGWRLAFDDRTFKVYENPRFGAKPDPSVRLLLLPLYYKMAWEQARAAGRPDLAAFAEQRLASSAPAPSRTP